MLFDVVGWEFVEMLIVVKVLFLLLFVLVKSCANLVVGAVADARGRRCVVVVGWSVVIVVLVLGMIVGVWKLFGVVMMLVFFFGSV